MKSEINYVLRKYADKKTTILCLLIVLGGLVLAIYDYVNDIKAFDGKLSRPAENEHDIEEEILLQKNGEDEEMVKVHVSSKEIDSESAKEYLKAAAKEVEDSYLGKNKTPDNVTLSLNLRESYQNKKVKAEWSFSDGRYIKKDGTLIYDEIEKVEDNILITLTVTLKCAEESVIEEYPVMLSMPSENTQEGFAYYLKRALNLADDKEQEKEYVQLPDSIGEIKLTWSKKFDNRGLIIAVLGAVAFVGIILGRKEEERRKEKNRQTKLTRDYPVIVSMLSLYVSAGVTVRSAFKRIYTGYMQSKSRGSPLRPGYESLGIILRKMDDGVGETEAYSDYGKITGNENYMKLSMLLVKNIRHGQRNLAGLLEKEEAEAFFKRKLEAKRLGEEASTKLLIPMVLLLGVVLVIMIAPAMFSLKM